MRPAARPGFAAITPALIAWGEADTAHDFLHERLGGQPAEIFEIPAETMNWLDRNPFIGGQEARIRESGTRLHCAVLRAA